MSIFYRETGNPRKDNPQNKGHNFSDTHPFIPPLSVYTALRAINADNGEKTAIDCMDLDINYNKMFDDAITISRAFKELGVKRGDVITVCMPNLYQSMAIFLACNRIGVAVTFLNSKTKLDKICDNLNFFESSIYINFDRPDEENETIKKKTGISYIITLEKSDLKSVNLYNNYRVTKGDYILKYNTLGEIGKYQRKGLSSNHKNDTALILHTSGTTGDPKNVDLSNENILAAGIYLQNSSKEVKVDWESGFAAVPNAYPYGFFTSQLTVLLCGNKAIVATDIDAKNIEYYLSKGPNMIFGSPALLELIVRNVSDDFDLSSVTNIISGGDWLSPAKAEEYRQFFIAHGASPDLKIGVGFGNAETVSCGANPTGIDYKPGTVGKILTGTKVMVIDPDTKKELNYDEEGLICIAGKHVCKGYYKDPDGTKKSRIRKGFHSYFKTGGRGFIDKEGNFTLTARESRFYTNSDLDKVYCDPVQTLISYIDCVDDCAVVKVPDPVYLYKNAVYIVLKKGIELTPEVYEQISNQLYSPIETYDGKYKQLEDFQIPTYIKFVDSLPRKDGTEKIDYALLEKDAEEEVKNISSSSKEISNGSLKRVLIPGKDN